MKKIKILYGIQGTGNGHLSRAQELLPYLREIADVDVLISGMHYNLKLNIKPKFKMQGLGFFFGTKGGIDILKTIRYMNIYRFIKDIKSLDVKSYDLVISDFEPVTAWAAKVKSVFCLGMSHQSSMLMKNVPLPENKSAIGMCILKYYAPCKDYISFHFKTYSNAIFTPIIRKEIRNVEVNNLGHYTVYLPAFGDKEIIKLLSEFKDVNWQVFSKHAKFSYDSVNIKILPVESFSFMKSISNCSGVLCGAGFETPAEALFLGKKLIVVPMKGQYEQECNAAALKEMGVAVINNFFLGAKEAIKKNFFSDKNAIRVEYTDNANRIVRYLQANFIKK